MCSANFVETLQILLLRFQDKMNIIFTGGK